MSRGEERQRRHLAVARALRSLSDGALTELIETASVLGTGIGGTTAVASVEGTAVFCKTVPLTALEARPEHVRSTANLFGLPAFCHYGIGGSPGFGVWRELAAHIATTRWVLEGRCESFPLLHHWRVLPAPAFVGPLPAELCDVDRMVAFWAGSSAVRTRLEAIAQARTSVVLVCEYIPATVNAWLPTQVQAGPEAADAALAMVDTALRAAVAFLNANGWLHFDAHFGNVLTDGDRVYLTDFGLVASDRFVMAEDERAFVGRNAGYDRSYGIAEMANWIAREVAGFANRPDRLEFLRSCASGRTPAPLQGTAARLVSTHAPTAVAMNDFISALAGEARTAPYPAEILERLVARIAEVP